MKRLFLVITLVISHLSIISYNASAATGDSDSTIYFNGTNTTFQVADANTLDISNAITMEAWAKPTGTVVGTNYMVMNKENAYELWIVNGYWNYALNGSVGWVGVNTGVAAINDQWQHLAVVRQASTNSVQFYFNGNLAYNGTADGAGTGGIANSSYPFQIGARSSSVGSGFSTYFKGEIDEVKIFSVARSASQIITDMSTYGPTNTTGLVMYFDFNDYSSSLTNRSTSGVAGPSSLTAYGTNSIGYIETTTVTANRKVVEFSRTYLSSNGWKIPSGIREVWALVIGGGGGGGSDEGGGGGGGGFVENKNFAVTPNSVIEVVVGGGGAGAYGEVTDAAGFAGGNGADSKFGTLVAIGGGGGGSGLNTNGIVTRNGKDGGSGGGGGGENVVGFGSAGLGTAGQGFDGGVGKPGGTVRGGGGGGAGESGNTDGNSAGGDGLTSTIENGVTAIYYAGGGGGGGGNAVAGAVLGGDGGGGNGGGSNATPTDGVTGTGGGGGGGSTNTYRDYSGFTGGTGTVILAFTAFPVEVTSISNASFRTTSPIVVTLVASGKVTFYAFNKKIPQCINISTVSSTSITATCNWKPSQRGYVNLTAKFVPTSSPSTSSNITIGRVNVAARSGAR